MTRPERQPSPFPGLKKMVEWESFDGKLCVRVDPRTRFLCPGCATHASWLNSGRNWLEFASIKARIDSCAHATEHERMHTYWGVAIAKPGTRLRYLGQKLDVDYDPYWQSEWMSERIGWVGELQKFDYNHRVEVATQELWVTVAAECFELAPGAPLGNLGGPREHSMDRSRWASDGDWQLEVIVRSAARLRRTHGASVSESVRLARVDLECFLIQDRKWQAEHRAKLAREGTPCR